MSTDLKSKSGKSTFDPVTKTWTWTTKKGKVVSRSDDDYQKRLKALTVARLKRQLEGPKPKDEQTTSKKAKKQEKEEPEEKKKDEIPVYIKKMMKEMKQLKSMASAPIPPKVKVPPSESVDGGDEDILVLDRKNREHAKILAQPGIEEVTDPAEHGNDEMSAHDKAFKALLFQDASVIVPVHDQVSEDD